MSARPYSQTIGAGETIRLPAGRYLFVEQAASALNLSTQGNTASPVTLTGVGAGAIFGPVAEGQGWKYLDVFSAAAQNIKIWLSDDGDFRVANAVTVSGVAQVQPLPAAALADTADTAQAVNTQTAIAANLSRRRITIGVLSTSVNGVRVSQAGGAGRGQEIQPGMSATFEGTYALFVRNDATLDVAAAATWYAEEES